MNTTSLRVQVCKIQRRLWLVGQGGVAREDTVDEWCNARSFNQATETRSLKYSVEG
eukprot:m.24580 g.24580  ORF g.24580 m.24580 type:complete len:56 (+) comp8607_c0_seq1:1145-1312(+)